MPHVDPNRLAPSPYHPRTRDVTAGRGRGDARPRPISRWIEYVPPSGSDRREGGSSCSDLIPPLGATRLASARVSVPGAPCAAHLRASFEHVSRVTGRPPTGNPLTGVVSAPPHVEGPRRCVTEQRHPEDTEHSIRGCTSAAGAPCSGHAALLGGCPPLPSRVPTPPWRGGRLVVPQGRAGPIIACRRRSGGANTAATGPLLRRSSVTDMRSTGIGWNRHSWSIVGILLQRSATDCRECCPILLGRYLAFMGD